MPKSPNQKLKLLYIRDYLLCASDEEHPVTTAQIIQNLAEHDVPAERKSIYDDIDALTRYGLDLHTVRIGPVTGYFVGARDFQLAELKLLVDSVQCSKFITRKKSTELITKIEGLASRYDARRLQRQVFVTNRVKTMNESIYYIVDDIHNAIAGDKKITFKYYKYSVTKERVYRRGGEKYVLSPFALMWEDENYYLVGWSESEGRIKHFRVDKLSSVELADGPRAGKEVFAKLDLSVYSDNRFGMFAGELQPVRMEFAEYLAGAVIDRFGRDVALVPIRSGYFTVTVSVAVNEQFFGWLCGFGADVRILSPEGVAEDMRRHIDAVRALY